MMTAPPDLIPAQAGEIKVKSCRLLLLQNGPVIPAGADDKRLKAAAGFRPLLPFIFLLPAAAAAANDGAAGTRSFPELLSSSSFLFPLLPFPQK